MAFGFVVARFGLVLRELAVTQVTGPAAQSAISLPLGVGIVLLGVVVNVVASWHHVRYIQALKEGSLTVGRPSRQAIILALILAAAGLALALYLGMTRASNPGADFPRKDMSLMKTGDGIISKPSKHPVPETLDRVEAMLRAKGIKVFVRVDHSDEAEKVGLKMPPTQLLIFGNPKGGTAVILAAPTAAIDLPLKALARQDTSGQVWLSYNDPAYLMRRFGLNEDEIKTIVPAGHLLEESLN